MSEFDPGDHSASIVSVTDQVRPLRIGMPVTSVHFLGDNAAFVGAEESVFLVGGEGEISPVAVHGGGILCAASDGERIVMGGLNLLRPTHRRAVLKGMAAGAKPLPLVESPGVLLACACLFPHLLGYVGRIHHVERVRQAHGRFRCNGLGRLRRQRLRRGRGSAFRA